MAKKKRKKSLVSFGSSEDFEKHFFPKEYAREKEEDEIDKMQGIKRCPTCRRVLSKRLK